MSFAPRVKRSHKAPTTFPKSSNVQARKRGHSPRTSLAAAQLTRRQEQDSHFRKTSSHHKEYRSRRYFREPPCLSQTPLWLQGFTSRAGLVCLVAPYSKGCAPFLAAPCLPSGGILMKIIESFIRVTCEKRLIMAYTSIVLVQTCFWPV